MTTAHPPTETDWKVLEKVINRDTVPTVCIGKGFTALHQLDEPRVVYENFLEFCEDVRGVYFAEEDAGNSDNPLWTFRDCLPFDNSDYYVDRIMFSTKTGCIVYIEYWSYYYDDDECGKTSLDVYTTYEQEPREILNLAKHAHIRLV